MENHPFVSYSLFSGGSLLPESLRFSRVIGETQRKPQGAILGQVVAEDMLYSDQPNRSIQNDPLFIASDSELESHLGKLLSRLSMGDLETVAMQMH